MPKKKENLSPEERLAKAIIPKEEEPYKLPDNWVWIKLGETGDYKKGPFGSSLTKSMFVPKGENTVKVYEQKNAIQKDWKLGNYYITEEYFNKAMTSFEVKESNIIVSCAGTIGETYIMPENIEKGIINQALMKIDLNKNINKKYYLLYFDYILKRISNTLSNGSAIKNIPPFKIFKELPFALSPQEEQKRIVEKLDSLFEKIGKIKEIIEEVKEKTSSRREAVLSKAFTGELTEKWRAENKTENAKELLLKINEEKLRLWEEECKKAEEEGRKKPSKPKIKDIFEMFVNEDEIPYKVPDNWVWTRLGDITNYGEVKQIKAEDISENDWILELEDIEKGTFKLLNRVLKKERQNKSNKHVFFKGDILYSKLRPYLNKILIAEEDGYATTEIIPFKGLFNLDNKYIFYYFTFSKTIEMINFLTHGMQMPRLGTDKAKNLLFPLPPLEEQKEIVRILDKIFEEEEKISELISIENQVEILEKTILDKAFRGELGTGNIDDEPALELLKKVIK